MNIFNKYWWKDFWYNQISSRISPRQRWLTKKIPRTWVDKDSLTEICVIESLKHLVEGEKFFETIDITWCEEAEQFGMELKNAYEEATITLPSLEKKLEEAWKDVPRRDLEDKNGSKIGYKEIYGEVDKLEKEIYDLKTKIMTWIISRRDCLCT